jgi:hypothetical protein
MKIIKNKQAFEMSFAWIFAIIAGSVIILLAIYGATKFVNTTQTSQYSESAMNILNMLNPVVNGVTSAYSTKIEFPKETRLYLGCTMKSDFTSVFGRQTLAFSEQSSLLRKWPQPGINVSRYNKYIFSNSVEQGKTFYIFSKPFYTGFRVDDLVFMNANKYCFVAPPMPIQKEIEDLNLKNVNHTDNIEKCKADELKVCFGFNLNECDMTVSGDCEDDYCGDLGEYDIGKVEKKNGKVLFYTSSLIYAAIFSSPEIYECNIARLANKVNELAKVYKNKAVILRTKECNTIIDSYLDDLITQSENITTSSKFIGLRATAKLMDEKNCADTQCPVYNPESCL